MENITPNIIMIVADDLGCCDIGCYGNTRAITPHIDTLAANGVLLENHYSASPMCAPARAALLTGKYPQRTGAIDVCSIRGLNRVNPGEPTLPRILKKHGYTTGLIGKWHNGGGSPSFHPSNYGYDEFCGFEGGGSPYFDYYLEKDFNQYEHVTDTYITDRLTDEAISFIDRNSEAPFHLQLAYNAPHRPLEAPAETLALFDHYEDMTRGLKTLYAMVTRMDYNIGRLLSHLHHKGLSEHTIILFLSDNGPDFLGDADMAIRERPFHHFNGHKGDVLEGGIRVPAIVSWPGHLPSGKLNRQPSIFMDWLPTFASLLGIKLENEDDLDGKNIWNSIYNDEALHADYFWHWTRYEIINHSNMAIYHNGFKLYYPIYKNTTQYYAPDSKYNGQKGTYEIISTPVLREHPDENVLPMLFYLPDDPGETQDVSCKYPELVKDMAIILEKWHQTTCFDCKESFTKTLKNI